MRLDADIEALAQKMKEQKEEAYSEGYKAALEWFRQEDVTYKDVSAVFSEFDDLESAFDSKVEEEYESWEKAVDDDPFIGEALEREERRFWKSKVEGIIKELPSSYDITDAFVEGFRVALQKLYKAG
jgi:hypothetical protein